MDHHEEALDAIRKKLVGKQLNYQEIYAIMDEISNDRLGDVLTTYFAASGYSKGFTDQEIYYLTKAMVETGDRLEFRGIVADKHSIGGVPGTRTTMIDIPIVAAAGYLIPKSSSRAITTPGGTADDMEVLAKVDFTKEEIYEIVRKTGGCIVWGGSVHIAPADDEIIKVEAPLMYESFDKVLVSIMAKKIAFGSNHVVIDIPYGDSVKVHSHKDAEELADKFKNLAKKFDIKLVVNVERTQEPAGRGIGPLLETRDALRVLEQLPTRPLDLEKRALDLAGKVLDLCLEDSVLGVQEQVKKDFGSGREWAKHLLQSGQALKKMRDIIKAQGGDPNITSNRLVPGRHLLEVEASKHGVIKQINSKNASVIAKILGCPKEKRAGIYLEKKIGDTTTKGELLYTLYATTAHALQEAHESLANFPIFLYD
jgi:putative thymidine phosphorylase